jgi:hypothetical protein
METLTLTRTSHCLVRARQRGYRPADLGIIETLGNFSGDGLLLRRKDAALELERLTTTLRALRRRRANRKTYRREIEADKHQIVSDIERLQRLQGSFIPIESGQALSIYRPSKRRLQRLLHGRTRRRADGRRWR